MQDLYDKVVELKDMLEAEELTVESDRNDLRTIRVLDKVIPEISKIIPEIANPKLLNKALQVLKKATAMYTDIKVPKEMQSEA